MSASPANHLIIECLGFELLVQNPDFSRDISEHWPRAGRKNEQDRYTVEMVGTVDRGSVPVFCELWVDAQHRRIPEMHHPVLRFQSAEVVALDWAWLVRDGGWFGCLFTVDADGLAALPLERS